MCRDGSGLGAYTGERWEGRLGMAEEVIVAVVTEGIQSHVVFKTS